MNCCVLLTQGAQSHLKDMDIPGFQLQHVIQKQHQSLLQGVRQVTEDPSLRLKCEQVSAVRLSHHPMALWKGCPVCLSHATVVCLWLVMPNPATLSSIPWSFADCMAPPMHSWVARMISSASCSIHLQSQAVCRPNGRKTANT